mgnify:CR=1 FL=1
MEKLNDFLEKLHVESPITLEEIPDIDLYMDQVIQMFENKFNASKRNEEEKVLTKTMINNYAKGKVFLPIKNKKYSKEHLMLISLIYQLKGSLSIKDIKDTLQGLNTKLLEENFQLDAFYQSYLTANSKNKELFKQELELRIEEIQEDEKYLEQVLLISSLVQMSNLYRRVAEKLVDELNNK